jgi:hypothetical protein
VDVRGRIWGAFVAVIAVALFVGGAAHAEKRVALVIGNSAYTNVPHLDNPAHDARLMADTLKAIGFELIGNGPLVDLDKPSFDNALQKFGDQVVGADVALFYYAGHGVQVSGRNFLVPVTANPVKEADVYLQMIDTAVVLSQMESAGTRLNIVVLDACRNNPFGGRGLRATSGGLAQMQAPEGTLISYATQPGNVALDGASGDSPFTLALAQTMRKPGLDIFRSFNEVGLAVATATGGAQQPWVSLSPIKGDFYFAGQAAKAEATPPAAEPPPRQQDAAKQDQAAQAWGVTQNSTSVAVLEDFIREFDGTIYSNLARARLNEVKQLASRSPPNAPSDAPARVLDQQCATERTLRSVENKQTTTVTFSNQSGSSVRLYWLDYGGQRKLYATLSQGQTRVQSTYMTHPWVIADLTDKCIAVYMPEPQQSQYTIR